MIKKFLASDHSFKWLYFLLGILLILGVIFRFAYLDRKLFWADEAITLLRISGYAEADFLKQFSFEHIVRVDTLQQYQKPHLETGIAGTVKGLATEEPQLSPLYFILLYGWIQNFGDSIAIIRSLSVLLSLLLFPAIYWFCLELFKISLPAWIAIGLFAVSPLQIGFAQEARPYAFWLLTFVLSNAALLRAIRLNTYVSWAIYAITIPLSIYTYFLSVFLVCAHSVYIFWHERFRISRLARNYLISLIFGILCSLGWLIVVAFNLISIPQLKANKESIDLLTIFKRLIFGGVRNLFFDLNNETVNPDFYIFGIDPNPILSVLLLCLITYCFYIVWRKAPRSASLFIVFSSASSLIPLIFSGKYFPRYLIPFYLVIQLIVAYTLAIEISRSVRQYKQLWWRSVLVFLTSLSIFACVIGIQKETSWIKHGLREIQTAHVINQSDNPLVISDTNTSTLLMLSRYLNSKVHLQIEPSCGICTAEAATFKRVERLPNIPKGFERVFLYAPSHKLLDSLAKTHTVKLVREASLADTQLYLVQISEHE